MNFTSRFCRLPGVALMAMAAGLAVSRGETGASASKATEAKQAAASAAKEKARNGSNSSADLQRLVEQLGQQRDTMIADSEDLAKKLKDATDAQKKVILEKMSAQKKAFEEATSALQRQIADERRKQRQGAAPKR